MGHEGRLDLDQVVERGDLGLAERQPLLPDVGLELGLVHVAAVVGVHPAEHPGRGGGLHRLPDLLLLPEDPQLEPHVELAGVLQPHGLGQQLQEDWGG